MAKMSVKGTDDLALKLSKLGKNADEIAGKVVRVGANTVADEIRRNLEKNLQGSKYSTGDLLDSMGISPPKQDDYGTNVKIGFAGYDRKGTPNALKARAMESGTSTQPKKPFVRPAINKMKKRAIDDMSKAFDEEMKIYAL